MFTVEQKLELMQTVARVCYIDTGDKWWQNLSLMIGEKLKKEGGK